MPVGRPPKPLSELKLAGHYRRDRHANRLEDPVFGSQPPEPAEWLDDVARAYWDRHAPLLIESGVVTLADEGSLNALCQWWSRWVAADKRLSDADAEDWPSALKQADTCAKRYEAMNARFGGTPADRSRIKVQPSEPEDDAPELKYIA